MPKRKKIEMMFVSRRRKIFTQSKTHFSRKSNIAAIGMRASEVFIRVAKFLYFFNEHSHFATLCVFQQIKRLKQIAIL